MKKRGNVWLGAAGLVVDVDGRWLVVKKRYGGLKGSWSLPAGFVEEGETADEAARREVFEETGIQCEVKGLLGVRTGVIRHSISDNMLVFLLEPQPDQKIKIEEYELSEAKFLSAEELRSDPDTSVLLHYLLNRQQLDTRPCETEMDPGPQFNYSTYRLFL